MHTDLRGGLNAIPALNGFEMDHRASAMRVALLAGLNASLAPDAPGIIDEEGQLAQRMPPACGSSCAIGSPGGGTLDIRTAQILNSGMFETGSIARMVQLLAERSSGQ